MATEIEAKVRIADPAGVERRLAELGAEYCGAWLQADTFFDHPDRALMKQDSALRLRVNRPLDKTAAARGESTELTYKGARQAGRLKVRPEHQVGVPDAAAMTAILHGLDFSEALCYEKRRRKWRLGDADVAVDEVPRLGWFVEIEASTEAEVDRLLDQLGFVGRPRITESYVRLFATELAIGYDGHCIRFECPPSA